METAGSDESHSAPTAKEKKGSVAGPGSDKKIKAETKNMFCDPTDKAYRVAEAKAKQRASIRNDPENRYWKEDLQRHVEALENITARVDDKSPRVNTFRYNKLTPFRRGLLFQTKIEADNAKLLRQLAAIYNGEIKTGLENYLTHQTKVAKQGAYWRALETVKITNENYDKFQCIQETKPVYSTRALSRWYAQQRIYGERASRYPNHFTSKKLCPLPFKKVMLKALDQPRQYAYLLVEVEDRQSENLVVELYADLCPFTVKNFQMLCKNTKATACDCRTYRCKKIDQLHSVQVLNGTFKKLYWVVGEHVDSTVEYSQMIIKEGTNISHTEAGLVTRPKGRAGGTFFITVGPCKHLDQFCYVFGKIDKNGMAFMKKMEEKNTEDNGQTIINMHVTDCGALKSPEDAPPPMLLHDFITQARLEIIPFIRRKPGDPSEWTGGNSEFKDYLKDRANEGKQKYHQAATEARIFAEDVDAGDEMD